MSRTQDNRVKAVTNTETATAATTDPPALPPNANVTKTTRLPAHCAIPLKSLRGRPKPHRQQHTLIAGMTIDVPIRRSVNGHFVLTAQVGSGGNLLTLSQDQGSQ